jgi:hypothetical protein
MIRVVDDRAERVASELIELLASRSAYGAMLSNSTLRGALELRLGGLVLSAARDSYLKVPADWRWRLETLEATT